MRRLILRLFFSVSLLSGALAAWGQGSTNLASILQAARNPYIKPEALDQLMIRLRSLEPGKDGVQPDSLFLAYRLVADGYALNNHFRQAYDCYNRYIGIKETMLGQARRDSIRARQEAIRGRVKQEEGQVIESNNLVQNLQIEIDQQTSRHAFMRQFFSIALVALTALIALMLVRSGIRLNGYKQDLKASQQHLRELHRNALLGKLSRGIFSTRLERRSEIMSKTDELLKLLQSLPADQATEADRKRWLEQARQIREVFSK
ncbi:MAG: hypothetical protein ACO1G7_01215 [Bacteroidota bacterium]|nr:hypothetical protein [Bacteroidia bacterium]MBP7270101.1 hypothetical protein [Bacteroidia bacterium]MBP7770904.1 hypothetical protein [Bacteroidia bacterium]